MSNHEDDSAPANSAPTDTAVKDDVMPSSEANPASEANDVTVSESTPAEQKKSSLAELEAEGDIAADYIEELLDITDLDGDIDIDARDGRAYVSVNSTVDSNLRLLSRPDTVNALQELTRIAVQTKTGSFSRLILDIGGSRKVRQSELAVLVDRAIERLEAGAESAALPPMSSYERKLVHDVVAERGYSSESEGEGRDRHTVITRS